MRFAAICLAFSLFSCRQTTEKLPAENPPAQSSPALPPSVPSAPIIPPAQVEGAAPVIQAEMSSEFLEAFKESKECRGIQFIKKDDKRKADFRVLTSSTRAETPEMEELWLWTVFDGRGKAEGELRGAGNELSAATAMKDMCTNVWDAFNAAKK